MRINSILFLGGILFLILVCSEPEPDPVRTGRGYQDHSDNKHDVQKIHKIKKRGIPFGDAMTSFNMGAAVMALACEGLTISTKLNCGSISSEYPICDKATQLGKDVQKLKQTIDKIIYEEFKLAKNSEHVKDIGQQIETLHRKISDMAEINFDILTDLKVLDLSVTYERNPENQKFRFNVFMELSGPTELAKRLKKLNGLKTKDIVKAVSGIGASSLFLCLKILHLRAQYLANKKVHCVRGRSNAIHLRNVDVDVLDVGSSDVELQINIPIRSYESTVATFLEGFFGISSVVNAGLCASDIYEKDTNMKKWNEELTNALGKVGSKQTEAEKQQDEITKSQTKIEKNFDELKTSALGLFKVLQGDEKVWGKYRLKKTTKKDEEEVLTEVHKDNSETDFLTFRKNAFAETFSKLKNEIPENIVIEQMKPKELSETLHTITEECEKLKTYFLKAAKKVRIFSLVEKGVKERDNVDKIFNNIINQDTESTKFEVLKSIADQTIGDEVYEGFPVGCIRNEKIKSAEDLTNFWSLEKGFPRLSDDNRYLLKLYSDMNLKLEWVLDFTKQKQMFAKNEKDVLLKVYANSIYPKEEYKIFGGEKIVLGEYRDDTICCVC